MPRVTINLPEEMIEEIDSVADDLFCSRSSAVRVLYRQWRSGSTSTRINLHQPDITSHPPDPAPAREPSTQVVVDQKTTTDGQNGRGTAAEIARLFVDLDWRAAVLPKRLTPEAYAEQLLEMFPDKNLVQQIRRAQIWHLDRKPSWKRLAHSLNNWLAKPTPPWEKEGQQPLFKQPTPQSEQQDYEKGVDEHGNW